jgi:hypothetical protein
MRGVRKEEGEPEARRVRSTGLVREPHAVFTIGMGWTDGTKEEPNP